MKGQEKGVPGERKCRKYIPKMQLLFLYCCKIDFFLGAYTHKWLYSVHFVVFYLFLFCFSCGFFVCLFAFLGFLLVFFSLHMNLVNPSKIRGHLFI